jgi:hypothetical protein
MRCTQCVEIYDMHSMIDERSRVQTHTHLIVFLEDLLHSSIVLFRVEIPVHVNVVEVQLSAAGYLFQLIQLFFDFFSEKKYLDEAPGVTCNPSGIPTVNACHVQLTVSKPSVALAPRLVCASLPLSFA